MQTHPMCKQFKVTNLTESFDMLEQTFSASPAPMLFLSIYRLILEKDAVVRQNVTKTNWLAIDNLQTLNRAKTHGLWNGTIRVFESGSTIFNSTKYDNTPSTIGAMMNLFLGIESKVFMGTPVSTLSNDVTASQFYRDQLESYQYLPDGLAELWTNSSMTNALSFYVRVWDRDDVIEGVLSILLVGLFTLSVPFEGKLVGGLDAIHNTC
jgi:hypothetical protein